MHDNESLTEQGKSAASSPANKISEKLPAESGELDAQHQKVLPEPQQEPSRLIRQ